MDSYETVATGDRRAFGEYAVTAAEIREFASQYDPQPIHTDAEAAADSMFGGLVASGWHTAAVTMRMLVEDVLRDSGVRGAIGVDELRWPNPVRPGDVLAGDIEVTGKEPFDDDRGLLVCRVTVRTQDDETVLTMAPRVLIRRAESA